MPENIETKKEKFFKFMTEFFNPTKEIFKTVKLKDGQSIRYQFADVRTKDGATISYDGEMPMEGMPIWVIPSDGTEPIAPADGVLILEDGTEIEVKGGVIAAVKVAGGAAPAKEGEMGTKEVSATEAAAVKSIIESTIKETTFSKDEVVAMFATHKAETEKEIASLKEANVALSSANESLTTEIGKVSAANETMKAENAKLVEFSKQFPEFLKEIGMQPQVEETEEQKKKRLGTFSNEKPKAMTDKEFRDKYSR